MKYIIRTHTLEEGNERLTLYQLKLRIHKFIFQHHEVFGTWTSDKNAVYDLAIKLDELGFTQVYVKDDNTLSEDF